MIYIQLMQDSMKIEGKSLPTGEIFHIVRRLMRYKMKLLTNLTKK